MRYLPQQPTGPREPTGDPFLDELLSRAPSWVTTQEEAQSWIDFQAASRYQRLADMIEAMRKRRELLKAVTRDDFERALDMWQMIEASNRSEPGINETEMTGFRQSIAGSLTTR